MVNSKVPFLGAMMSGRSGLRALESPRRERYTFLSFSCFHFWIRRSILHFICWFFCFLFCFLFLFLKGKRLFMPIRLLLTGSMQGPDVGTTLSLVEQSEGVVSANVEVFRLEDRISALRQVNWSEVLQAGEVKTEPEAVLQ